MISLYLILGIIVLAIIAIIILLIARIDMGTAAIGIYTVFFTALVLILGILLNVFVKWLAT